MNEHVVEVVKEVVFGVVMFGAGYVILKLADKVLKND